MIQDITSSSLETAQSVADIGMMATCAGFFLVLTALLWIVCFRWFQSLINGMIKKNDELISNLLTETREQNNLLSEISEGLRPETELRIKNTAKVYFDLAVEKVIEIIKRVKEENHISDREHTTQKIRTIITNLHEDRNSSFDSYTFRGRKLSEYTNTEWIEWIESAVLSEVYSDTVNEKRTRTNIKSIYDKVKLDFYHRMNN